MAHRDPSSPVPTPAPTPAPTVGRREFLSAAGAVGIGLGWTACRPAQASLQPVGSPHDFAEFEPVVAGTADELRVPKGFTFDLIAKFGDQVGKDAKGTPVTCGAACDFTAFQPLPGMRDEGLLFVNHEYPEEVGLGGKPVVLPTQEKAKEKTGQQIENEMRAVGFGLWHVRRGTDGAWKPVTGSDRARRVDATGPAIEVVGPAKDLVGAVAAGSLANCSGGVSEWATFSCEENHQNYFRRGKEYNYGWTTTEEGRARALGYGWVVEVPHDPARPMRKHTALGRFRHENVAMRCVENEPLVVYMGDDGKDQHFYKFVSSKVCGKPDAADNSALLEDGTLYVADFKNGEWLPIDLDHWQKRDAPRCERAKVELKKRMRDELPGAAADGPITQAVVLTFVDTFAKEIGGTPLDRPEDCEIGPDGRVYLALTNNDARGNFWGSIARLEESEGHAGTKFTFVHLVHGGDELDFACPDNLCFDPAGDLWFTTDRAEEEMGKPHYRAYGNNSLFRMRRLPARGGAQERIVVEQFCVAPVDAELTGPTFSPDGSTLFLSVQHPGITAKDGKATSRWPADGPDPNATANASNIARSAVVAIRRKRT